MAHFSEFLVFWPLHSANIRPAWSKSPSTGHYFNVSYSLMVYLIFPNSISHINYCAHVNSWKNFLKFWYDPLCRNKSGPSLLLNVAAYWKSCNTEVPRNCLRYLQTTLIMDEGDWSQNLCEVLFKEINKKLKGVWKNLAFF